MACATLEALESQGGLGMSGTLQSALVFTLLEEETLDLLLHDSTRTLLADDAPRTNTELVHPKYGCSRQGSLLRISVFSNVADLLSPYRLIEPKKAPAMSSKNAVVNMLSSHLLGQSQGFESSPAVSKSSDSSGAKPLISYITCPTVSKSPLPGSLGLGQLAMAIHDSEGVLRLSMAAGAPTELPSEDLSLTLKPAPQSTLEIFAAAGGLATLAHHLQLYHPHQSLSIRDEEGPVSLSGEAGGQSLDPYLDPFEFIDGGTGDPLLPSAPGVYATTVEGEGEVVGGGGGGSAVVQSGLSPHVTVAFALFLRLPGYAQLLVAQDRRKAQRLLRLAMGLNPGAGGEEGTASSWLFLLPFSVLSTLYARAGWADANGRELRERSLGMGIPQLLLACLSAFGHQEPVKGPSDLSRLPPPVLLVQQLLSTRDSSSKMGGKRDGSGGTGTGQYWAKGTGFGTGSTAQQWNIDLHNIRRQQDEQNVTCIIRVLSDFVYPLPWSNSSLGSGGGVRRKVGEESADALPDSLPPHCPLPPDLSTLLWDSALQPVLESYLRNDSVLDMGRHVEVYEAVLGLLSSLALAPGLASQLVLGRVGDGGSVWGMLEKLRDCMLVYVSKLKPLGDEKAEAGQEDDDEGESAATEEGLLRLVPLAEKAVRLLSRYAETESVDLGAGSSVTITSAIQANLSVEARYMDALRPLQFDSSRFFEPGSGQGRMEVAFHYESSIRASRNEGGGGKRMRRLAQEAVTLSTSLPLSASSSVFVRTAEERLDLMKVLITENEIGGPVDTPYSNGCFEFDVWFPSDYPNSPMNINLQTTGGGTVRFNPNLYNDGKVCLSVLNTWHGRPEERWNPQTSSFLQVLVSIQSLILVSEPYFNEPGYERSRSTPAGQQASREYDANLRQATVRWAMLEVLRNNTGPFADVVRRHFWLKRHEITTQIQGWIREMEEDCESSSSEASAPQTGLGRGSLTQGSSLLVSSAKHSSRNIAAHLAQLNVPSSLTSLPTPNPSPFQRHFTALKEELRKIKCPEGLEEASPTTVKPPILEVEDEGMDLIG